MITGNMYRKFYGNSMNIYSFSIAAGRPTFFEIICHPKKEILNIIMWGYHGDI